MTILRLHVQIFLCCFAGTAGSGYLLTSRLIPPVHPGTTLDARDSANREVLSVNTNQHRSHFQPPFYAQPTDLERFPFVRITDRAIARPCSHFGEKTISFVHTI